MIFLKHNCKTQAGETFVYETVIKLEVTYYLLIYTWTNCFYPSEYAAYIHILTTTSLITVSYTNVLPACVLQLCFKKIISLLNKTRDCYQTTTVSTHGDFPQLFTIIR